MYTCNTWVIRLFLCGPGHTWEAKLRDFYCIVIGDAAFWLFFVVSVLEQTKREGRTEQSSFSQQKLYLTNSQWKSSYSYLNKVSFNAMISPSIQPPCYFLWPQCFVMHMCFCKILFRNLVMFINGRETAVLQEKSTWRNRVLFYMTVKKSSYWRTKMVSN